MQLYQFLNLARAFRALGDATADQLVDVVINGEPIEDQNASAMKACLRLLDALEVGGVPDAGEVAADIRRMLERDA